MGDKTGISWTDATWNPVKGCSRVSAGCQNCYAEVQAARIVRMGKGKPTAYDGLVRVRSKVSGLIYRDVNAAGDYHEPRWTGEIAFDAKALALPLRWSKPRRIFVNSMSDLFHEKLTNEQIAAVFGVMAAAPRHTFQVLTKRARRMREWFEWASDFGPSTLYGYAEQVFPTDDDQGRMLGYLWMAKAWPTPALPNVWLGVSVENQEAADERIPELLRTPAAVRFLSCEPLLGPVDLRMGGASMPEYAPHRPLPSLDWIIAGCESGPGARPCSVEWLRSLRDQCASAGVAFFLKQAVEPDPVDQPAAMLHGIRHFPATKAAPDGSNRKPGGVIELPYLDGVQHAAFPEVR